MLIMSLFTLAMNIYGYMKWKYILTKDNFLWKNKNTWKNRDFIMIRIF